MVTVLVALLLQQPVADLDTVNIANGQFFFVRQTTGWKNETIRRP
jgi:hypothetical protein